MTSVYKESVKALKSIQQVWTKQGAIRPSSSEMVWNPSQIRNAKILELKKSIKKSENLMWKYFSKCL